MKGVFVEGLPDFVVKNYQEVAELMEDGNEARAVAATNMHERSSRSHTIFSIMIRTAEGGWPSW